MTIDQAADILSASDYSATPAQYSAALALTAQQVPAFDFSVVPDAATYAAGYAAAHPGAPAGASNTWLWVGGALAVWWVFFRRR